MPRQEQPFAFALSLATLPAWRTEGRSCFSFSILLCVWTWISIGPLRILILGVKKTAKLGFTRLPGADGAPPRPRIAAQTRANFYDTRKTSRNLDLANPNCVVK